MGVSSVMGIVFSIMLISWPFLVWKYFALKRKHAKLLDDYYDQDDDLLDVQIIDDDYDSDEENDAWEGGFWDAGDPKTFHLNLEIDYSDANGDCTKREISVKAFDTELYSGIIMAHCHLRNATRTFRFDRIASAINTDNGEIIDDIRSYMLDKYRSTPLGAMDHAIQQNMDAFDVLFYLAKTDGRAMPKEKEVMAEYYRNITGCPGIEKQDVTEIIGKHEPVKTGEFKKIASRVKESADHTEIMHVATQMVAASKEDIMQKAALVMLS